MYIVLCPITGANVSHLLIYLFSLVHPRARSYPNSVSVEEGENLTLTCTAEGYPLPVIVWFKDGLQLLADVEMINNSLTSVQNILHINSSVLNDTGQYHCQASSTFDFFNMSVNAISEESTVIILGQFTSACDGSLEYDVDYLLTCVTHLYPFHLYTGAPSKLNPVVLVRRAANSLLLGWTEPTDNGAPITQYVIREETIPETIVFDVFNGTELQVNVTGLLPNTNYTFTIVAVNAVGSSDESDPVTIQTAEGE